MHAAGMRLVLDMVVNHTGDLAQLPRQKPGWFHDGRTCGSLGDPTIFCPLDDHPDLAQERPEVAAYLSDVASRWTSRHAIDGIRMDTARHVLPSYFATSFHPAVRGVRPELFTVAEIFDESSLGRAKAYLDANFDSVFHFPLRRALVDAIVQGGSVDKVASAVADGIAKVGMDRALDTVLMMDNHDVPRFVNEPGNTGAARSGTIRVPVPAAVAPPDASLVDELGDGAPVTTTLDGGRLVVDLPAHSAALYRRR